MLIGPESPDGIVWHSGNVQNIDWIPRILEMNTQCYSEVMQNDEFLLSDGDFVCV